MAISKIIAESMDLTDSYNFTGTLQQNGAGVGGVNTPAFRAYISADQTLTTATITKAQFNTEVFDTDNCYDTSTYRFTPNVAGKYFFYTSMMLESLTPTRIEYAHAFIYKNGSEEQIRTAVYSADNISWQTGGDIGTIVDMNGSSDYVEAFVRIHVFSGTPKISAGSKNLSIFGAYKIIE
jgi:hypothetical protein